MLLAGLAPLPAARAADGAAEGHFVDLINRERAARGLAPFTVSADLRQVARRHSARMAADQRMFHNPDLASQVGGYRSVGENVGYGGAVEDVHDALMASASHRANLLSSAFTQIGVGVEWRDGTMWITQVFREPSGRQAAPRSPPHAPPSAPPSTHTHAPPPPPGPDPAVDPAASDHLRLVFARVEAEDSRSGVAELVADALQQTGAEA